MKYSSPLTGSFAAEHAVPLEIAVGAAEEAEELIEATLLRMVLGFAALVPFADEAGVVAGGFEAVGDGGLVGRQSLACAAAG